MCLCVCTTILHLFLMYKYMKLQEISSKKIYFYVLYFNFYTESKFSNQ